MNIADEIQKKIRQELDAGATQKELGKKYGMTQGNISRILSGTHTVSFDTLERMFPNATINLHGDPVVATNSGINNGVVGVNNGSLQQSSAEAFRDRAIRAILDLDLPPEVSILILKTLKDLK